MAASMLRLATLGRSAGMATAFRRVVAPSTLGPRIRWSQLAPQGPQAAALQLRGFSSEPSMEERVISAVKRYIENRKDDLSRDNDVDTNTKSEILKAFDKDISPATSWEDLKFDDVDKVEVLLEVEEEFNHVMPDAVADKLSSVKEVIEYLQQR